MCLLPSLLTRNVTLDACRRDSAIISVAKQPVTCPFFLTIHNWSFFDFVIGCGGRASTLLGCNSRASCELLAVIFLTPAFESTPNIVECSEPAGIQAFVSQPAVEALDIAVLHRAAGLDVNQADLPILCPGQHAP
jgi:hypothetical protein